MAWKRILLAVGFTVSLAACSSESAEVRIHNHLEEAVVLEEGFEEQQSEITALEKQEQELYSQIVDMGSDEMGKIKETAEKAIDVIDEREERIELEKESINSSEEEFLKIEPLLEEVEAEETQAAAQEMYQVMESRYASYEDLYTAYKESLELERELYNMLGEEELEQDKLTEHIDAVNESYERVLQANEQFNNETVEYNALKQEFYESTGMNVAYEENSTSDTKDEKASAEEE
ncbi:YkyA family protein [Virgibacillus xinjiangensis]|uniref:YkyA family protein n=1 Tax=Virgibacillus xinjiangensis TaxID=393090 RepID=A0ABV7CQF8_9BACI